MGSSSLINIFDTCFKVCFAFTVLFLIISVILFFLFDIKAIFSIRTGRAKKKTVKEMQVANSKTGRLRVDGKTLTSKLSKEQKEKTRAPIITPPQPRVDSSSSPTELLQDSNDKPTEVLQGDSAQTEVLSNNTDEGATSVLSEFDTAELRQHDKTLEEAIREISFTISKKIMYIHTDEVIN